MASFIQKLTESIVNTINYLKQNNNGDEGFGRKRRAESDWNSDSLQFKYRRVDCEIPKTFARHIQSANFADIEFSDDEDDEISFNSSEEALNVLHQTNFSRQSLSRSQMISSSSSSNKVTTNVLIKQRKQPPLLIQARTGNMSASTLTHVLQPIRQPTYSSIHSACTNRFDSNSFANNIEAKPNEHIVPIKRTPGGFSSVKRARSILVLENQLKEKEKYRELLQKLVPNLYGIKVTAPKLSSLPKARPKSKDSTCFDLTERELSGENILPSVDLSDDDDVYEIIDLTGDEVKMFTTCSKLHIPSECSYDLKKKATEKKKQLHYVEPVNSLKDKFSLSPLFKNDWLQNFRIKWGKKHLERKNELVETEKEVEELSALTRCKEKEMIERFKKLQIVDPYLVVIDDFPEEDEEPEFPELTPKHESIIKNALFGGPTDQTLITKFNTSITRRDICTLLGKTWLNDAVINFYMNLLQERSELRWKEGLPKVYAMNTFFVPRLRKSGHSGVRRWTRKVDIFSYDIIPVPVHVGGAHWCMAIIHLRERSIKYYDSMGTPNPTILKALKQYLHDESLDKRKRSFDTSDFIIESVKDVPHQMNGHDCGVFSCMFAEYITRNREITFTQQHMEYFRNKMILEIVQGALML